MNMQDQKMQDPSLIECAFCGRLCAGRLCAGSPCGKPFVWDHYHGRPKKYCSKRCCQYAFYKRRLQEVIGNNED